MVAGFISYFNPIVVLCAAVTTMTMVIGLTITALFMKEEEVSFLAGFTSSFFLCIIPILVFSLMFPTFWISMLVEGIVVVLFSIYIIFDTRMIMNQFSYDEYIIAAVMLYVDIIGLFITLLILFGSVTGGSN